MLQLLQLGFRLQKADAMLHHSGGVEIFFRDRDVEVSRQAPIETLWSQDLCIIRHGHMTIVCF